MGLCCISLSFLIDRQDAVVTAHQKLFPGRRALVSPAINGWVTLADERLDSFQQADVLEVGSQICATCGCPALGLGVLHSDYFYLWVFDASGGLAAHFTTERDAPSSQSPEAAVDKLVRICDKEDVSAELLRALTKKEVFADFRLSAVGNLLGISHLGLSYHQAIAEWDEIDESSQLGWDQFRRLGAR